MVPRNEEKRRGYKRMVRRRRLDKL
jgi:hypothetical protein